jgi:hypothetical protein
LLIKHTGRRFVEWRNRTRLERFHILYLESGCALNEILQTAARATWLFAVLDDLLEPGTNFVWREQEPGRGTEMRPAFSALFRTLLRALLSLRTVNSATRAVPAPASAISRTPSSFTHTRSGLAAAFAIHQASVCE